MPYGMVLEFPPAVVGDYHFVSNRYSFLWKQAGSGFNLAANPTQTLTWSFAPFGIQHWDQVTHIPETLTQSVQEVNQNEITGENWPATLSNCTPGYPPGAENPSDPNHQYYLWYMSRVEYRHSTPNQNIPRPYARQYNGVCGAHWLQMENNSQIILTINHGENGNLKPAPNGKRYDNTFNKDWCSIWDPSYYDNQGTRFLTSYGGIVTASYEFMDSSHGWGFSGNTYKDLGPIAWPSNGYMNSAYQHIGQGVRHPSSILVGTPPSSGHLYVFFTDTTAHDYLFQDARDEGERYGVKCVRVPVNYADNPSQYRVFYNGNWNSPSIPSGLTKTSLWVCVRTLTPYANSPAAGRVPG